MFWPLQLLSKHSGVHRDSNSQSGSSFGSVKVHSLTLSFTPGLPSWPSTLQALTLVASLRLGLQQFGLESFVNIPFHGGACIPSFTFQEFWDASIWNIRKLNGHFILPFMAYPRPPQQVLVWERGLGGVLDTNGMRFQNPSHDWKK